MAQLPAHFTPSSGDSAGQPWAGRTFESNPFADDDGTTPPTVAEAMARFREREVDETAVVEALRESRVLIPLVAELGEAGENDAGVTVDKSADLSIVTVAGPDGRTVLPVFTSAEAMRTWNPQARPVPSLFRNAAVAAADERTDLVIVDPGSTGEFGLRRPAVWAVAQGESWVPAVRSPEAAETLAAGIAGEPEIVRLEIGPGSEPGSLVGPELHITIVFAPSTDAETARAAVARASAQWGASESILALVDSMKVALAVEAPAEAVVVGREAEPTQEPAERRRRGLHGWLARRRRA